MSIATQIDRLVSVRADCIAAIMEMGGTVPGSGLWKDIADGIATIGGSLPTNYVPGGGPTGIATQVDRLDTIRRSCIKTIADAGGTVSETAKVADLPVAIRTIVTGKKISEVLVGETVKIKENGVPVEYLKVHQGIPSSLYDASCDGAWLLREDCYSLHQWNSDNINDYENSTVDAYLEDDFYRGALNSAGNVIQVKIPYRPGSGKNTNVNSGEKGLLCHAFLLGGYEVGYNGQGAPVTGSCLSYFPHGVGPNPLRVALYNGNPVRWWMRDPAISSPKLSMMAQENGASGGQFCTREYGVRPCIIIKNETKVDDQGNLVD